jgi:hypothetical protein
MKMNDFSYSFSFCFVLFISLKKTKMELADLLQNCWQILGDSISEPKDLKQLMETYQ